MTDKELDIASDYDLQIQLEKEELLKYEEDSVWMYPNE